MDLIDGEMAGPVEELSCVVTAAARAGLWKIDPGAVLGCRSRIGALRPVRRFVDDRTDSRHP